jgi:signal transduction histidine kinase
MHAHITQASAIGALPIVLASFAAGAAFALAVLALTRTLFGRREVLRRSEHQLRAVLDQMPIGVVIAAAPGGEVQFANPEVERLLGHPIVPGPDWEAGPGYGAVHPDGTPYPPQDHPLLRALEAGARVDRELLRYRRPDGRTVELEVSSAPILDQGGRAHLAVTTLQDVTQERAAEEALRQAQRMEAIGQLTGGIAHDFNNLLTAVLGNLSLLLKRGVDGPSRPLVEHAVHAARRGAALTAQLLAFSRRQKLQTERLDLNGLIERMGGLLSVTLGGALKVDFRPGDGLPQVLADATQLELALLNLAINARDAMAAGGTLTIATGAGVISRQQAPHEPEPGDYVWVAVADTGTGMPPEVQARAFEPFFTTKPAGRGSGLGLSQVLGLVKQIGGGVRIESEPGNGTRLTLYLRAGAVEEVRPPPRRPPEVPIARIRGSLLVVDDDADVRDFLAELFSGRGGRVECVESGLAAIARVRSGFRPDLTLLDVAMPEMSGVETARRLRQIDPGLQMVLMTGYMDPSDTGLDLIGLQVLAKPFDPDALLEMVAKRLARAA